MLGKHLASRAKLLVATLLPLYRSVDIHQHQSPCPALAQPLNHELTAPDSANTVSSSFTVCLPIVRADGRRPGYPCAPSTTMAMRTYYTVVISLRAPIALILGRRPTRRSLMRTSSSAGVARAGRFPIRQDTRYLLLSHQGPNQWTDSVEQLAACYHTPIIRWTSAPLGWRRVHQRC